MGNCFYTDHKDCTPEYCEFMIEDRCRAEELEELVAHIRKIFPNISCYVEDGGISIDTSIISNQLNGPVFKNATTVRLSPYQDGQSYIYADIFPVEDGPVGPYKSKIDNEPWKEIHPIQKWMINPECFVW